MAAIFITGSTDCLGRAAARALIDDGHHVVLHARSRERASVLKDLTSRSVGVVVGDLRSATETRSLAEQVNAIATTPLRMDLEKLAPRAGFESASVKRFGGTGQQPSG